MKFKAFSRMSCYYCRVHYFFSKRISKILTSKYFFCLLFSSTSHQLIQGTKDFTGTHWKFMTPIGAQRMDAPTEVQNALLEEHHGISILLVKRTHGWVEGWMMLIRHQALLNYDELLFLNLKVIKEDVIECKMINVVFY